MMKSGPHQRSSHLLCRVPLALVALAAVFSLAASTRGDAQQVGQSGRMSYYDVRRSLFAMSKIETAPIVMLGDSHTEAGPWTDLTGCLQIANRGIGGDTTTKLRDRLDQVVALRPRAVFLMIGVNDIQLNIPRSTTLENLRAILERLTGAGSQVYLSYVMPVTASYRKRINGEIAGLNSDIAKLVQNQDKVTPIDVGPKLRGADGALRGELAYDGLHLTPRGYAVLRDAIAPYVAKYCSQ